MYQLTASYAHPLDPEAFLEHYRDTHAPIAREFPKATFFGWTICETPDGSPPPHILIAVIHWESKEDALAALASPAGQQAVADLANFAAAGVDLDFGEVNREV